MNKVVVVNFCDHENLKVVKWHEDGFLVEEKRDCKDCGKCVYHLSYGQNLIMDEDDDF